MEEWKRIKDFPDYEVSNLGNVKSYKRKVPIIMKPSYYSNGYTWVHLRNENGGKSCLIHRLVLSTFCPCDNMENLQVNHKNCKRDDNRLENLEWATPQENRDYREKQKHTPKALTILVKFLGDREDMVFDSITSCAEYFGISRKAISKYIESQTVRKDRQIQAHFYIIGKTYDINKEIKEGE